MLTRPAGRADIPALVRLRLVNAERHVELDPSLFRVPSADAVREHFEKIFDSALITVAEVGGEVVGMAEVVPLPPPPDHQILVPRRAADVHTVVLDGFRGRGIGKALVAAAQEVATAHGAWTLNALIFTTNEEAVAFYSESGFGPHGILLARPCG
jgi:GNAT superfamily N-acetyltransferase